jgi:hypothetical protein
MLKSFVRVTLVSLFAALFGTRLSLFLVACFVLAASTPQHAQNVDVAGLKSGIIVEQSNVAPKALTMEQSMDVKMTGAGKAILTQGFSSPKQVATHSGARATVVLTDAQPTFLFRFIPESSWGDPFAMMAGQGLPVGTKNPKEFVLAPMTVEGDTRVLDTGKIQKIKFKVQSVKPNEFRVSLESALAPGEYAFFMGQGGGMPQMIWAFSYRAAGH